MPKQKLNKKTFSFIDLFAGIGGFRLALEDFGGTCVFSSEWDKNSQDIYSKNFSELPDGDITKIKEKDIPEHDILCAGFPCQAFSISGKRLGFKDIRGSLFFDVARIAKHHKPDILFLENVKNFAKHDNGNTLKAVLNVLDDIGYKPFFKILKSSDYGLSQARERIYIVAFKKSLGVNSFKFPNQTDEIKIVNDILENEQIVPKECYINRSDIDIYGNEKGVKNPRKPLQIGKLNKGGQGERVYSIYASGITLSAYGGGAASKTGAYFIDGKVRKLTPRECARMQGFPENFILPQNRNIAYKQFGDSVSVPVLKAIFAKIIKKYPKLKNKRKLSSINKKTIQLKQVNLI
ncbi:MAG: DNA cytosine methyltransferase [Patescibacteria group bacterium]|nr:DNA cytosine methyltransferase [Patescibacteria group bacterium]